MGEVYRAPIHGWAALFRALYLTENYDKKCEMMAYLRISMFTVLVFSRNTPAFPSRDTTGNVNSNEG